MAEKKSDPKLKPEEPTNPATAAHLPPDEPKHTATALTADAHPAATTEPTPVDPEQIDDAQVPKNYTPRGDAVPITDPLLSPEAQQPFESAEDYERRMGKPTSAPGTFDAMVGRGEDQK